MRSGDWQLSIRDWRLAIVAIVHFYIIVKCSMLNYSSSAISTISNHPCMYKYLIRNSAFIYNDIWQRVLKREPVLNPPCLIALLGTTFPKELLLVHKSIAQLRAARSGLVSVRLLDTHACKVQILLSDLTTEDFTK